MTTAAIDYIWQAIRESERSDKLQFLDDEILIKAKSARLTQPLPDQSDHRDRAATDAWRLSADGDFAPMIAVIKTAPQPAAQPRSILPEVGRYSFRNAI